MNNFTFQNPVKLIFGKGSIAKLAKEIPADKKIMVTFGGGSVKKNGVYDQVVAALKGRDFVEFWGIEPNPKIETLRKAIAQGKAEKVDFILAVGGGSTLDGTKLIAAAIPYAGDAWELVLNPKLIKTWYDKIIVLKEDLIMAKQHDKQFKLDAVRYYEEHKELGLRGCAENLGVG